MADSWNKKERKKKKEKKKKEKLEKKEARKAIEKDSSLEGMMAYVDENGNIVDAPSDKEREEIDVNDIVIGVPEHVEEEVSDFIGKVEHYNESKGYGFIKDKKTQESYFFHVNSLNEDVNQGDQVTFSLEKGKKGMVAVDISLK